jgi:uncharacterized membrane protein
MEARAESGLVQVRVPAKILRRAVVGLGLLVGAYFLVTRIPRFLIVTEESYEAYFWPRVSMFLPHVLSGLLAITIGPLQLWAVVRNRYRTFHRVAGRTYVAAIAIGAVYGMALSLTAPQPVGYRAGLFCLAIAWLATTGMAFAAIRRRRITQHRQWMIRSYVVTFAFVTFRLGNDLLMAAGMTTGRGVVLAWGCWAIPLLITEMALQAPAVFGKGPAHSPEAWQDQTARGVELY